MGSRFSRLVALAVVVVSGMVVAPASASVKVLTTVVNNTNGPLRLENGGNSSCWNGDDLINNTEIAAGARKELYSSIKSGSTSGCESFGSTDTAWQLFKIAFKQPNGFWTVPQSSDTQGDISTSNPDSWARLDKQQIYRSGANNVYFKDVPTETEWLPISPTLHGTSGLGFYCLHVDLTKENGPPFTQTVDVNRAGNCASSTTQAADTRSSVVSVPANARAAGLGSALSDDESRSYNLYNMFNGACDLLKLSSSCSSLSEDGPWDWSNVTSDVKDLTAIDPPPASYNWKAVNPPYVAQDNETNVSGSLSYTFTFSYGETYATATQEGFKVGTAFEYQNKLTPYKFTVSAEFNFSNTNTHTTGTTESTSISTSVATQPDGWTYLYGFDGDAETGFHYAGDLTLGNAMGEAEPLKTPVPANMGYSPATLQPCVGYLVGTGNVSGSAEDLDAQAIADGYSPSDLNLTLNEREFLEGAPLFNTLDIKPCPGFTDDYRSGFGFDGSGTESALALGGTSPPADNVWFDDLGSITTCAYFYPNDDELNNSVGQDNPCQKASAATPASTRDAGNLIRLTDRRHVKGFRYAAPGAVIEPTGRSEAVAGDSQAHKIILGAGTFNIVKGGSGADTVMANGKTAVVQAGSGNDVIKGGSGYDTLIGGSGHDELIAGTGRKGTLIAGSGRTELVSGPDSHSGIVAGPGTDTVVIHNTPRIGIIGGSGDDSYYLYGKHASDSIVERSGGGIDTVYTDHSLTIPMNIEVGKALAPRIALTGLTGTQELVGSPKGHDTLVAGPGEVRLIGAGADNTLILSGFGFDKVTGGSGGGNRFVLGGLQFNDSVPRGQVIDAASEITDFRPAQGDRLVLSAKRFGNALLSRGLTLVQGRDPGDTSAKPTLMFDTARKLLTFDPDGSGPAAPRVLAILAGLRCSSKASTETAANRQLGIHVVHGTNCLPTTALEITR